MKKFAKLISMLAVLVMIGCCLFGTTVAELPDAPDAVAAAEMDAAEAAAQAAAEQAAREAAERAAAEAAAQAAAEQAAREAAERAAAEAAAQAAAEAAAQAAAEAAAEPVVEPAAEPAEVPAEEPTEVPAEEPTEEPSEIPAEEPAAEPAEEPVEEPAEIPAEEPAEVPAEEPEETPAEPIIVVPVVDAPAFTGSARISIGGGTIFFGDKVVMDAIVENTNDAYRVIWQSRNIADGKPHALSEAELAALGMDAASVDWSEVGWKNVKEGHSMTVTASAANNEMEYRLMVIGTVTSGRVVSGAVRLNAQQKIEATVEVITAEPAQKPAEKPVEVETEVSIEEPVEIDAVESEIDVVIKEDEIEEEISETVTEDGEEAEITEIEDYETPLGMNPAEYAYEKDEENALVLDENGDPIAILEDGQEIPKTWVRDEEGELVLDEEENPIATQSVPADAVIVHTLQDQLNPDRYIEIYVSFNEEDAEVGDTANFRAVLYGYDSLIYSLQWQQSDDGANWEDLAGANNADLEVVTSEENKNDYWRVQVTITGILG